MPVKVTFKGVRPTELAHRIKKTLRTDMPREVKIAGLKHFNNSFRLQGFTDEALQPWKPRKSNKKGRGRGILIKSSKLMRSIGATIRNDGITFQTKGVPYAQIHNEGGRAGRMLKAIIPKRQYMGKSARLLREVKGIIIKHLNRI